MLRASRVSRALCSPVRPVARDGCLVESDVADLTLLTCVVGLFVPAPAGLSGVERGEKGKRKRTLPATPSVPTVELDSSHDEYRLALSPCRVDLAPPVAAEYVSIRR